ncbi:MAG TPA: HAD family hydrolase [Candidatus Dormibacteraeota bacterium]|nr:HAD family hydrolase [Candidatus Dormibacteraeota bacterium]
MPTVKNSLKFQPQVIIFDVDGVLVDVRGSFHRTTLETVRFFTNKRVTTHQLQKWKNQSGFNDDWKLSTAWVQSLGGKFEYDEVKRKFVELYWGASGDRGNVEREKWLLPKPQLRRLAARAELAIFTGRVRKELDYTLDRNGVHELFGHIVTAEVVSKPKPAPEGLLAILNGRDPAKAIYVGDNVDDALAAQAAGVAFVGVVSPQIERSRARAALLRKLGAKVIVSDVKELESRIGGAAPISRARTSVPSTA